MTSSHKFYALSLAFLVSLSACMNPPAQDKPSSIINLDNWKLSVPVIEEGAENPVEIMQPELRQHSSQYMFVAPGKKEVVFQAPTDSAIQPGSDYPRAELREMKDDGKSKAKWSNSDSHHALLIEQAVTALPSANPYVVAGQIHNSKGFVILVRLDGTHLYVKTSDGEMSTLDDHYVLGTFFSIKITAGDGNIAVAYNDGVRVSYKMKCSSCYFKAGIYLQTNADMEGGRKSVGEVRIRSLSVTHD